MKNVQQNKNITLHLDLERVQLKDLSAGQDKMLITNTNVEKLPNGQNFTPPGWYQWAKLERTVKVSDVRKQKLRMMPGFKLSWYYSGMKVDSYAKYNGSYNIAFTRNCSMFTMLDLCL